MIDFDRLDTPCIMLDWSWLYLMPFSILEDMNSGYNVLLYTCQLFLRYKREIFILWVLGFLKTTRSFPKIPEEVRSLPKKSEVFRRRPKSAEGEVIEKTLIHKIKKVLSFIHFTHGFRSLHGSELTYFWKLCQARRQQLTFSNQAWEIGPQVWAGVRSKFSTRRRESWQVYYCISYEFRTGSHDG